MTLYARKEIYLLKNTLSVVPLLLNGLAVLIDQRDETSVAGVVENADGYMNINLLNAVFIDRDGLQYYFEEFMVRERMIRYIHLPIEKDIKQEIKYWHENGLRKKYRSSKEGSGKLTFKRKRAETRHKEILQIIQNQKTENAEEVKYEKSKD